MPDAVETVRQDMDQEAADELVCGKTHCLLTAAVFDAVILPAERDGLGVSTDEAAVRDGDTVGVSAEVGQHRLGATEGGLGINHPFGFAQGSQPSGEGGSVCQLGQVAEERKIACAMQGQQPFNEQTAKQPGKHSHMQEEPWFAGDPAAAVRRHATTGDDHMDMRVVGQCRSPGMQHAGHANPCAEALGIGRDGHHGLGRSAEQQAIDGPLVPIGDAGNLCG